MIKTIKFNNKTYPILQTEGFASKFAFPFAKEICIGTGYDIGCGQEDWVLPGAIPIDPKITHFSASDLPNEKVDYIFSSHCLEHLYDWVGVLDYWITKLKNNGIIFLYLPHYDQEYWRPWNNRKHKNILTHNVLTEYFKSRNFDPYFVTKGYDLNHSFYAVGQYNGSS